MQGYASHNNNPGLTESMLCTLASSEAPLLRTTMLLPEAVGSLNQPPAPLAVASVAALQRVRGGWMGGGGKPVSSDRGWEWRSVRAGALSAMWGWAVGRSGGG